VQRRFSIRIVLLNVLVQRRFSIRNVLLNVLVQEGRLSIRNVLLNVLVQGRLAKHTKRTTIRTTKRSSTARKSVGTFKHTKRIHKRII